MRAAVVAAAAWLAASASALEWLAATGAASVVHVFPANATYRYFSVVQFRARGGASHRFRRRGEGRTSA